MKSLDLNAGLDALEAFQTQYNSTAFERLNELGLPGKKTEQYRYFDIAAFMQREWRLCQTQRVEVQEGKILEIVDGVVVQAPKGIKVSYSKQRTLNVAHFDPLYYLGHILSDAVIHIEASSDAKVKIVHRFTQSKVLYAYRVMIETAPNISLQIAESFVGCEAKESFVLYGYDLHAARDARVTIIKDETLVEGIYTPVYSHFVELEAQSSANMLSFDYGNADGLQLFGAKLGRESEFNAQHLLYVKGTCKRGTVSKIIHADKNAKSRQRAKNILGDKARGIFDALIKIEPEGGGTKALQNSQAVLLNDGAYMASKPQLEIYIDDVEASHGSTIGELDEQALFYLRSRGITLQEAQKMLILAFANEIIDAIEDEEIRESVHHSFEYVYYGEGHIECIATCHNCSDSIIGAK